MYRAITSELRASEKNDNIKAVLFTGIGDSFTSGNDLKDFAKLKTAEDFKDIVSFLHTVSEYKKPMIAAVNGLAIGIGTTLLFHCDLAFATPNAHFQLPFIDLGLCPEGASSLLLTQTAGYKKATELLMTGRAFTAQEALEFNMINELFSKDSLLEKTLNHLNALTQKPTQALQVTKQLLKRPHAQAIAEAIEVECAYFIKQLQTQETQDIISNKITGSRK
ncbi:enoyl-CoA hydratase-related protein [Piscirickettsia litoralis]|uniref:enoyl-CoA hydratase-related protein n=1 Tax=Piscirickettsia litoralis TaxID=1891921 RepID=UPI000A5F0E43|nr:enoyl-CoA hydratase-related protein [Piscirickettsia litoralis]